MEYKIQYVHTVYSPWPIVQYYSLPQNFILYSGLPYRSSFYAEGGHISAVLYEHEASQTENKNVTTFGLYTLRATNAIVTM